jgi:hypothetical protein
MDFHPTLAAAAQLLSAEPAAANRIYAALLMVIREIRVDRDYAAL